MKFLQALLSGLLACLVGGFFWGLAQFMTGLSLQLAPMLSMGCAVGLFVGSGGRGRDRRIALLASVLAVFGCFVGNFFALGTVVIHQLGSLPHKPFHPAGLWLVYCDHARWFDVVIYLTAALEGYHFAAHPSFCKLHLPTPGLPVTVRQRIGGCAVFVVFALFFAVLVFNTRRRSVVDLVTTPAKETVAVSSSGLEVGIKNLILFWEPGAGAVTRIEPGSVGRIAWSPDGHYLAFQSGPNTNNSPDAGRCVVWDQTAKQIAAEIEGQTDFVRCLAFSCDGQLLATGSQDGTTVLWSVPQFNRLATLQDDCSVNRVVFSPDSSLLASGLRDGTLSIWDVTQRRKVHASTSHKAAVTGLVFALDGQTLVSAGGVDGTVKLHALNPLKEKASYPLEMGWITGLVFSPDGKSLAVSGGSFHRPGEVKLYDWPDCVERRRFTVSTNTVSCAAFSRDGKTLIAGSAVSIDPFAAQRNGELHRWNVLTGETLPVPPVAGN